MWRFFYGRDVIIHHSPITIVRFSLLCYFLLISAPEAAFDLLPEKIGTGRLTAFCHVESVETETKSDLLNKISLLIAQHVNISQNRKLISRERSL